MNALVLGAVLAIIATNGSSAPQQQDEPVQQFDCTQDCDQQGKVDLSDSFAALQRGGSNSHQLSSSSQQSEEIAQGIASLILALNSTFQQVVDNATQTNLTTNQPNTGAEIISSTTETSTTSTTLTTSQFGSIDGAFWWQTTSARPPVSSVSSLTSSSPATSTITSTTTTTTTFTNNLPAQTTEVSSGAVISTTTILDAPPTVTTPNPPSSTEDSSDTFIDPISSVGEFITGTDEKPSNIGSSIPSPQNSPNDNQGLEDCTCVPYYQCPDELKTIRSTGLFNISGSDPRCERRRLLDVCCINPQISSESSFSTPSLSDSSFGNSDVSSSSQPRCGHRNTQGVDVHINNLENEVQFGEFPWMVALMQREKIVTIDVQLYQCGGSIIQPDAVLTAAHCVTGKDPHRWQIRAGEWDVRNKYEIYGHQDVNVKFVLIHPKYNPRNLHNDYAILFLEKPLTMQPNISPICLPHPEYVFPDNTTCYASGWGKTSAGKDGVYQIVQRKVELPLVHNERCQDFLQTTRLGPYFRLANEFICAGGIPGRDTCKGDGGAPLVCELPEQPGVYVQAGTVAWGIGCGEDGIPGVYADVAKAVKWIDEATKTPDRVGRIWEGY